MPYLGSAPKSGFISNAKERYTGITTAYIDLNQSITSLADVIVWVNFVKQDSTNLTLTTSTRITLGATLVASDIVEVVYLGKAVATQNPSTNSVTNDMLAGSIANDKLAGSIANSKLANSSITLNGSAVALGGSATLGGLSNADYWIFKTEQTISATTETTLTGGWAQQTNRGGAGGELGTGLSESSGIFSFPSTGIWHIGAWFRVYRNGDSRYINTSMEVTLNNSTYNHMSYGSGFVQQTQSANTTTQINIFGLVDCDNTTNVKFRYRMTSAADVFVSGDPNYSVGGLIAMRLGDT